MSLSKETEFLVNENKEQMQNLTRERLKNILQCRKDGFYKSTVPLAAATGIISYIGLRTGVIPKAKCGTFYQILSTTLTAVVTVETYWSWLCVYKKFPRITQNLPVKDEESTKLHAELQTYEPIVDIPFNNNNEYSVWDGEASNLNANKESINNNDHNLSDESLNNFKEDKPIKQFVTYDDLRKENRIKYNQKYDEKEDISMSENVQNTQSPTLNPTGKKQTKYGDVWDE